MMVRKRVEVRGLRLVEIIGGAVLFFFAIYLGSASALEPPQELEAFDMPSDSGDSIGLHWKVSQLKMRKYFTAFSLAMHLMGDFSR